MVYYDGSNNKFNKNPENNSDNDNIMNEYEGYEYRNPGKDYKLLEELKIAFSIPSRLKELMEVSKKCFVKYVIFVSLFAAIIIYLIPFIANVAGFGGFRALFLEKMPAFTYHNGELSAEKKFDMMISGYHIYIDTEQDSVDSSTLPSNGMYLCFGRKNMTFNYVEKSAVKDFSRVLYTAENKSLFSEGMNNATFAQATGTFYVTGVFLTILMAVIVVVKYLLLAFFYTAVMLIPYKLFIRNIYTDEAFKISYYAQTIGIFIVSINKAAGILLPELLVSIVGIFITFRFIKYTLSYNGDKEDGD